MEKHRFALLPFLLLFACGDGSSGATKTEEGPKEAPTKKAWDASLGSATVRGSVKFEGEVPKRRALNVSAEDFCAEHAKDEPLLDESVIVNGNKTLRNVFVWVRKGLEGFKFSTPREPALLRQEGCTYIPHVQGIQVRQKLRIRNDDPIMHNIRATPKRNSPFNFSQSRKGKEDDKSFRRTEVCVFIKCDVHGWMGAYVGVVPHPFFAVTGEDGSFDLGKLPPGEYEIQAWHEIYGTQSATVTLAEGETRDLSFSFSEN